MGMKRWAVWLMVLLVSAEIILVWWTRGGITANRETVTKPTTVPETIIPQFPTEIPIKSVLLNVPYTVQAPSGQWSDERFQDACEEANVLMAMRWVQGNDEKVLEISDVEKTILEIEDYEQKDYGSVIDTSADDTLVRVVRGYFGYNKSRTEGVGRIEDIVRELLKGNVVITPMNGQVINNPHYKFPGPARHMILVRGYDAAKKELITNDTGMRDGRLFRYPENIFLNGIRDYPSGDHVPIVGNAKKMIVIEK